MAEVPVFIRIRGSKDGSVNAVLGQVKGEVKKLTGDVVDAGTKIGVSFGAGSAAIVAMGAAALTTAGKFEQMGAKLTALLKDGEAAQRSLLQAASLATLTPFSVEGLVNATVQLTAYGQRARTILPQVADLAAAMGKSIEEASLAVGKAAGGSAEGYQSLRDTFGLTTIELKKLGVELNASGGPLLRTADHIETARAAMLKLIEMKFGGVAEAQSKTFEGAMNNLGDAVQLSMNKVGQSILPIATLLAKFAGDVIGRFQEVPGPIVATGIALGALTAGALALVSAATLVGAALISWYTSLEAAAVNSTVAKTAIDGLSAGYGRLAGVINTATASQSRWAVAARATALGLTVATGVYMAASIAIRAYEDAAIRAGNAIEVASKKSVDATNRWKLYRDAVNSAAAESGVMVDRGGSLGQTAEQIREAFAKTSPATLVANLEKAGVTLEDIRKEAGAVGDALDLAQEKFSKVARVSNQIPDTANPKAAIGVGSLAEFFPGRTVVTIEEIRAKVAELRFQMNEVARTKEAVTQALGVFEKFAAPLQVAIDNAKKLDTFLQFAKSSKDLQTLQTRLRETTDEVRQFEAAARAQGLPTEVSALQRDLLTATGTRAEFVKSFLGVLEQQASAERDLATTVQKAEQDKLSAIERTQTQRRAMSEASKADDLRDAKERLAAVQGAIEEEASVQRQLDEVRAVKRSSPDLAGVDERLRQLELELEGVRKLADEEVKARTEVRDAAKKLADDQVSNARQAIQDQVDAARELTAELKNSEGGSAATVSGQLTQVLAGLDRWEAKNKAIVASSRDVRRALEQARQAVEGQQAQIRERAQATRLDDIKQKVSLEVTDATDTISKLNAVRGAIAQINAERKSGLVDAQAAQRALTELQRQELQLNKQNNAEIASKAATLAGIAQGDLESQVEYLRARQAAGEDVTAVLIAKEKELLQAKLDAINAAYEADIAANKDREVAEAERSAAVNKVLRDEAANRLRIHTETQAAIDGNNVRSGRGGRSGRRGDQIGTGLGVGGEVSEDAYSTGIGTSSLSGGRQIKRTRRVYVPTPEQVGRQMGLDPKGQTHLRDLQTQADTSAKRVADVDTKAATQNVNVQNQFELAISVQGGGFAKIAADPGFERSVLAIVERQFRTQGYYDGGKGPSV